MWKTVLKTVMCVLLLGYVAFAFAYAAEENGRRKCPGIELRIIGNSLPDSVIRQGVNSQLARYPHRLKGALLDSIDLQRLERYLGAFSNFESVECSFDSSSRLCISVMPIKPEVRVFSDSGSFYINRYGKRIVADAEFFIDVPVLIVPRKELEAHIPSALSVIRYVSGDPELKHLISGYKLDGPHDIMLIPRLQGHVVNFGDSTRLSGKKAALLSAYRKVLPARGWNTYDTISVKFRDQIVATRRDKRQSSHGMPEDDGEDLEEATLPDVASINNQNSEDNG